LLSLRDQGPGEGLMSQYLFDHALDRERERLGKLSEWLDPGTVRHLETIGVGPGWAALEAGAGAGSIAQVLADRVGPDGHVLATDLDTKFLDDLVLPNLEVRKHDILNDDLPPDSFDIAHTRLLLMHLPDRELALKRIISAVKPGGWVFVEDMDMFTWIDTTPAPAMDRIRDVFIKLLQLAGADPFFGRHLPKLLTENGVEDVWVEGRIEMGRRKDSPGLAQFKLSLIELRDMIVANELATSEDVDEALRLIDDASWYGLPPSIIAAWGRKPER
jgi:SAM-dependent methyltransferase